jgi:hypothetical protein
MRLPLQASRHHPRVGGGDRRRHQRGQQCPLGGVPLRAGALYSTAPDYLTRMMLQGGQFDGARILRAETVALMGQNQIGNIEAGILKATNPALSNDVDFFPRIPLRWGLGHMINMEPGPDGRSAGSLTWAGLLNTYDWGVVLFVFDAPMFANGIGGLAGTDGAIGQVERGFA